MRFFFAMLGLLFKLSNANLTQLKSDLDIRLNQVNDFISWVRSTMYRLSRTYLEFGYGKLPNTGAGQTIREEGTLKLWLEPSLPYSNFFLQNSRLHKNVFKIHQVKGTHSLLTLLLHPWYNKFAAVLQTIYSCSLGWGSGKVKLGCGIQLNV